MSCDQKTFHRYVQYVSSCPNCHKWGLLFAQYHAGVTRLFGPYLSVLHYKRERSREIYQKQRQLGATNTEANIKATTRKTAYRCYFGKTYPGMFTKRIRGPDEPILSLPPPLRGFDLAHTKLSENKVGQIRKLYATGKYSQDELAEQFGVAQVEIGKLVRGEIRGKNPHLIDKQPFSQLRKLYQKTARGESHPQAKLTSTQVAEIRKRYAEQGITFKQLGQEYGVAPQTVHSIVRGKLWKQLAEAHLK